MATATVTKTKLPKDRQTKKYKDEFDPNKLDTRDSSPAAASSRAAKTNGHAKPAKQDIGVLQLTPLDMIDHNPHNARTEEEIERDRETQELADSIAENGLAQPILIRLTGDGARYVVIVGCRRRVACKRAGLKNVNCIVQKCDDEKAAVLRVIENLQRKDLTPIQEATDLAELQQALKLNQEQLGGRVGKSQAYVSTRLALLKLPPGLRDMIASNHLTPTKGRELAALYDLPKVMESLQRSFTHRITQANAGRKPEEGIVALDDDEFDNALGSAIEEHMRCMADDYRGPHFTPTPKQRKQLDVRTINFTGGVKETWAANSDLWDTLQQAAQREIDESKDKESTQESSPAAESDQPTGQTKPGAEAKDQGPKDQPKDQPVETISPAEQQRRAERAVAVYQKRLYRYKVAWLQRAIGKRLPHITAEQHLVLMIGFALHTFDSQRREHFAQAVKEATGKKHDTSWSALITLDRAKLPKIMQAFLSRWCQRDAKSGTDADPDLIESVAAELGIEFVKQWTIDREFLELHTTDQLADLVKEWKVSTTGVEGKGPLIDHLTTKAPKAGFALPKCLKQLKPVILD